MWVDKVPISDAMDIPTAFTALVREYERPLFVFLSQMLDDPESRERAAPGHLR